MPLYEYKCECGHTFEVLRPTFEGTARRGLDRHAECPKCGIFAKRVISQGTFILKGGGWYGSEEKK
ncbi:MAG: zinc ribbon domain-containing protein [bacterium]|nr:zinc ribbon domain-containing protein [bacterium]